MAAVTGAPSKPDGSNSGLSSLLESVSLTTAVVLDVSSFWQRLAAAWPFLKRPDTGNGDGHARSRDAHRPALGSPGLWDRSDDRPCRVRRARRRHAPRVRASGRLGPRLGVAPHQATPPAPPSDGRRAVLA